ncbi:P-loop containing nucleoside triphosphate hydrolase protein [Chytridium lagenaria]|nr:P-loop containing nucleoside triphosphate hydrolase protein [Chytridium lagenaria]
MAVLDDLKLKPLVAAFTKAFDGHEDLKMDFKFDGLSLKLPNGKNILQGVTGEIKSGRMTAIMGPSGAGKTTFMNVLMGKVSRTGGHLEINGSLSEIHKFKKIIGYVPQEDTMLRELTCKEVVMHSARCRLPRDWSNAQVEECVDAVLEALGLSHVAHTQIGDEFSRGVSGGQRKRVNIAMELAATPLAMFLDEPTSGLDATSALDVSQILRSISRLGLTIISVIHQPRYEIFKSFDDVLLIAPGGQTAYLGPIANVQSYFENLLSIKFDPASNPADLLMDILSGRSNLSTDEIVAAWAKGQPNLSSNLSSTPEPSSTSTPATSTPASSTTSTTPTPQTTLPTLLTISRNRGATLPTQTSSSLSRSLLQQSRFLGALSLELFVATFAGFLMGFATSVAEEPFRGVLVAPYARLSGSPNEWFIGLYGMLKPVYWREVAAGHSGLAYYIVRKILERRPRLALSSAHFTAVYYLLARPVFPVGIQYALLFLNFFGIYGVAVIVSMIVRRENAALLAVIVGLFSAVFCGFGPSLSEATEKGYVFVYNLGTNRWAAEVQCK